MRRRLRGWRGLNYGDGTATVEIIPLARPGLTRMVRIAITNAAYDAICAKLSLGAVGYEN